MSPDDHDPSFSSEQRRRGNGAFEVLSERELQVLKLVAKGLGSREIALRISLDYKTVETYQTRVFAKLGLKSRSDVRQYAVEHGLLSDTDT